MKGCERENIFNQLIKQNVSIDKIPNSLVSFIQAKSYTDTQYKIKIV